MLSYLTHKLRTPELNGSSAFHTKTDDDHDSGTESDDESAEIEELQKYMEHSIQLEDGSGHSPSRRRAVLCQHATRFRQTQQQTQQQDTQQQQQPNNKPMERRRQPTHHSHHQPLSGPAVVTALLSATAAGVGGGGRGPPPSVGGAGCGGGSPVLLDSALPSDSDPNLEQHSSEEELEVINNRAGSAEKRKWSQANQRRARGARASLRRSRSDGAAGDTSSDEEEEYDAASVAGDAALAVNGALTNGAGRSDDDEEDDDEEEDEEVSDLTFGSSSRGGGGVGGSGDTANGVHSSSNSSSNSQRSSSSSATVVPPAPVEFRASPPLHVHRPYNGSPPPKVFHAAAPVGGGVPLGSGGLGPTTLTLSASAHIPAFEVCAVSPRKRHRQDRGGGTAFGVFSLVDGGPVQRPCLDFEKMQQIRVKLL